MKGKIKLLLENKKIHYFIIFLFSCIIGIPLLKLQVVNAHDGIPHILRIIGTELSFKYIDFPKLIIPFFCNDFGYCTNGFYSPLVTYLPYFISKLPILHAEALKIFAYFTILISGFTMYNCTYEFTKKRGVSLFASLLYISAHYRFEDIYIRFAIGEFTTFIFIPIVFEGLHNLLQGDRKKHFYITIGAVGLMLSHNITTLYIATFCFIYVLFFWKKVLNKEVIKKLIINTLFILGTTAFYWIILMEFNSFNEYVIFDKALMRTSNEWTYQNTIKFTDFFYDNFDNRWNPIKNNCEISFKINVLMTVLFILTSLFIKKKEESKDYISFVLFAIISLFLCTNLCPWFFMPEIFSNIQYPWRMIGEFTFFASIICAVNLDLILETFKDKKKVKIAISILVFCTVLTEMILDVIGQYTLQGKINKEDEKYEKNIYSNLKFSIYSINRDYLPTKSSENGEKIVERNNVAIVVNGEANIVNQNKDMTNFNLNIESAKKDSVIELPYFYYPGYKAVLKIEGEEPIKLKQTESEIGLIALVIPKDLDKGSIELSYEGTLIEKTAYVISIVSFLTFVVLIIIERKKEKTNNERENKKHSR